MLARGLLQLHESSVLRRVGARLVVMSLLVPPAAVVSWCMVSGPEASVALLKMGGDGGAAHDPPSEGGWGNARRICLHCRAGMVCMYGGEQEMDLQLPHAKPSSTCSLCHNPQAHNSQNNWPSISLCPLHKPLQQTNSSSQLSNPSIAWLLQVRHRLPLLAPSPHLPVAMASVPGYTLLAAGPAIAALNESAAVGRLDSGPRLVLLDAAQTLAASCHQQVGQAQT